MHYSKSEATVAKCKIFGTRKLHDTMMKTLIPMSQRVLLMHIFGTKVSRFQVAGEMNDRGSRYHSM